MLQSVSQWASSVGVSAKDYASLQTTNALSASSALYEQGRQVLKAKIEEAYGKEVWEMFEALSLVMDRLKGELRYDQKNFPLTFSLPLVQYHHNTLPKPVSYGTETNLAFVQKARYYLDYACGAYGGDSPQGNDELDRVCVANYLTMMRRTTILMAKLPAGGVQLPGHFVGIDDEKKMVILGIRGTSNLSDAITDAVGESAPFPEYPGLEAHKAMLQAAREVIKSTQDKLKDAVSSKPGYGLIVTGHSLGAGTSILATFLIKAAKDKGDMSWAPIPVCWAYAPPPVISKGAAEKFGIEIYAFVNRFDVVPRASLRNVFNLGVEAMAVDKLPLAFMDRIALIRAASSDIEGKKQSVIEAVKNADKTSSNFSPLFIAGNVYWLEWPVPAGQEVNAENDAPPDRPPLPQIMHKTDADQFQQLRLKGGKAAMTDHLGGNYAAAIQGYLDDLMIKNSMCTPCAAKCLIM